MRSLHRNRDGHLAGSKKTHIQSVEDEHNIATLYVYTVEDEFYSLHEHYVYSHEPLQYKQWLELVVRECFKLEDNASDAYYGVFGWCTGKLRITPMRNGDLFIKVDSEGATGVRLSFDSGKNKHGTHKKAKQKAAR